MYITKSKIDAGKRERTENETVSKTRFVHMFIAHGHTLCRAHVHTLPHSASRMRVWGGGVHIIPWNPLPGQLVVAISHYLYVE